MGNKGSQDSKNKEQQKVKSPQITKDQSQPKGNNLGPTYAHKQNISNITQNKNPQTKVNLSKSKYEYNVGIPHSSKHTPSPPNTSKTAQTAKENQQLFTPRSTSLVSLSSIRESTTVIPERYTPLPPIVKDSEELNATQTNTTDQLIEAIQSVVQISNTEIETGTVELFNGAKHVYSLIRSILLDTVLPFCQNEESFSDCEDIISIVQTQRAIIEGGVSELDKETDQDSLREDRIEILQSLLEVCNKSEEAIIGKDADGITEVVNILVTLEDNLEPKSNDTLSNIRTLDEVLALYVENMTTDKEEKLHIASGDGLMTSIIRFVKGGFSLTANPDINYIVDDNMATKQEFFSDLMEDIKYCGILTGNTDQYFLSNDQDLLESDHYCWAGKLVAWSILHTGVGLHCLHPLVYDLIVQGEAPAATIEDVYDYEDKKNIQMLIDCASQNDFSSAKSEIEEWLMNNEIDDSKLKEENVSETIQTLIKTSLFHRSVESYTQFKDGLNEMGLLEYLCEYPEALRPLFIVDGATSPDPNTDEWDLENIVDENQFDEEEGNCEIDNEDMEEDEDNDEDEGDENETENKSLEQLLESYRWITSTGECREFRVSRTNILQDTIKFISDPFDFTHGNSPHITFDGEEGLDYGGPKREYFTELLKAVKECGILEGHPNKMIFTYHQDLLSKRYYFWAGCIVAWCVLHDGRGLPLLHPYLYHSLFGGEEPEVTVDDIFDPDEQERIEKLKSCKTDLEADQFRSSNLDWLHNRGIIKYNLPLSDVKEVADTIIKHSIYHRIAASATQFRDGLNRGELLDYITKYSEEFKPLFVHEEKELTADDILNICQFRIFNIFDDEDTDKSGRIQTENAFQAFLRAAEGKKLDVTLGNVLQFITGSDKIPFCGFKQPINIRFHDKEESRYPKVETCSLSISLPAGFEEKELTEMLQEAIRGSPGFGLA